MKISFIATVLNEEKTIDAFVKSILLQTKKPDEIIIVDGGSSDNTVAKIKNQISKIKYQKSSFKLLVKPGNRSVGRNYGILKATGDIVLISDAGCFLDKRWAEKIVEPFKNKTVDVVAGYYKGKPSSIFERCLVPYVLVMPDKIDPENFLPATRSMAFKKSVWEKVGGFPERFSNNEDYVFANNLKKIKSKIVFKKDAIVNWRPRKNLKDTFKMFFRFALGDAESKIYRQKVLFIFARYLILFYLFFLAFVYKSIALSLFILISLIAYIVWSMIKNYKYCKNKKALFYLPVIQLASDFAVLLGTSIGFTKNISLKSLFILIVKNKAVSIIIGIYVLTMLSVLNWGIPNPSHPFNYHMDEWHQLQAVRSVFKYGTPNIAGSANGTMLQFFLSGIYLIPFILFGVINPFSIKSHIDSLEIQQKLFEVLRLNTLFFGVASIFLIVFIGKKYFKINPFLTAFLFTINPLWISLSNYFKYDIALVFWILLSIFCTLRFGREPTLRNFVITSVVSALGLATKISALPIILILIFSFFLFSFNWRKDFRNLLIGLSIFILVFVLFGIPDLIFGKGNLDEYLRSNLINTPKETSNIILGKNYILFLFFNNYPSSFGHFLFYTFTSVFILGIAKIIKELFKVKEIILSRFSLEQKFLFFLCASFLLFSASLLPLKFDARGNRLLVLLPFIVLITSLFISKLLKYLKGFKRKIFIVMLFLGLVLQAYETFAWISVKLKIDPRVSSSSWIEKNIPKGTMIGLENIPIYQSLPDIILKEYYVIQYHPKSNTRYSYQIIDYRSQALPSIIIITNDEMISKYFKTSPKKSLLKRLENQGYKRISKLQPNFFYFKTIGSELIFFYSQLPATPNTISIFKRF